MENGGFLYIDPLKQGLKLKNNICRSSLPIMFLYIDPLKQGLKHNLIPDNIYPMIVFLYIDPLKQGLKHIIVITIININSSFYT